MKLVVDANILFAALIKKSKTAELILNEKISLFAPEFLFDEFMKYQEYIIEKTHRTEADFKKFLRIMKKKIKIIPSGKIAPLLGQASKISPDPKDAVYCACALFINGKI
ncbi:MAG: PIN domain-containing protein [Candidatus Helarchaeales archaeon]